MPLHMSGYLWRLRSSCNEKPPVRNGRLSVQWLSDDF
jgi:hypothetical protein